MAVRVWTVEGGAGVKKFKILSLFSPTCLKNFMLFFSYKFCNAKAKLILLSFVVRIIYITTITTIIKNIIMWEINNKP